MAEVRTIIPEKLYVGLGHQSRTSHPLAALTAWGTDAASKNRMQTVQSHSKQTWCMDNSPQWGIRIAGASYKDELFIQDPRGFSVSVGTANVLWLMKTCTVVDGVIQAPCVWARVSGRNILLVVGSQAHDLAIIQTRVANSKVSIKQVRLGDWITLQNGTQGVYMGKFHTLMFDTTMGWRSNQAMENRLSVDGATKTVLWQPNVKRAWMPKHYQTLMFLSNPTVAEHTPHDHVYTDVQAELKVNELLNDATCDVSRNLRGYNYGRVLYATRKVPELDKLIIQPESTVCMTADEASAMPYKMHYSENGIDFWMLGSTTRNGVVNLLEWDKVALNQNQLRVRTTTKTSGFHENNTKTLAVNQVLGNLYVMKSTYVSSLGNKLEACI
jgi:hypothetical protein